MDYKFNKVSLEQAPDIAVDLVTDAVCGYKRMWEDTRIYSGGESHFLFLIIINFNTNYFLTFI